MATARSRWRNSVPAKVKATPAIARAQARVTTAVVDPLILEEKHPVADWVLLIAPISIDCCLG